MLLSLQPTSICSPCFVAGLADPNDADAIGIDGVMALCEDLEVDPSDIATLVLAYKFEAEESGRFTKKEFTEGMTKLGCVLVSCVLDARNPATCRLLHVPFMLLFVDLQHHHSHNRCCGVCL